MKDIVNFGETDESPNMFKFYCGTIKCRVLTENCTKDMAKKQRKFKFSLDKKVKRAAGLLGVAILVLVVLIAKLAGLPIDFLFEDDASRKTTASQKADLPEGVYDVERYIDGDTFVLADGTKIRLIGANTPETVKKNVDVEPFGLEASRFTKEIIARNGNRVRITYDGTQIDRYGRTLAMVWLDDELLNERLIREGLAKAELQYNYSREMKDRFQAAENLAKREKRGIWSLPL